MGVWKDTKHADLRAGAMVLDDFPCSDGVLEHLFPGCVGDPHIQGVASFWVEEFGFGAAVLSG